MDIWKFLAGFMFGITFDACICPFSGLTTSLLHWRYCNLSKNPLLLLMRSTPLLGDFLHSLLPSTISVKKRSAFFSYSHWIFLLSIGGFWVELIKILRNGAKRYSTLWSQIAVSKSHPLRLWMGLCLWHADVLNCDKEKKFQVMIFLVPLPPHLSYHIGLPLYFLEKNMAFSHIFAIAIIITTSLPTP